ncbi:MAG: hypothetical protein IPJ32_13140 [Sphingobacteriaceae bacterium]|nr:hypothetical protein [Sphingobacteriaceae bacterium]
MGARTCWRDGKYNVYETDRAMALLMGDKEGDSGGAYRVDSVAQIGSNDKFIIIQSEANKYWIVDKSKDTLRTNSKEIVLGPYTFDDFKKVKVKLGITGLEFSLDLTHWRDKWSWERCR